MTEIRKRLTYANLMSTLAVFLVLGGAAVAATRLPRNSVGTRQLRRNSVARGKVRRNAIDSSRVRNGSLLARDFKQGQLPGSPFVLAFATVNAAGELDASRSKGFAQADVARDSTGTYCFSRIPAQATSAVATASSLGETNANSDQFAMVGFASEGSKPQWTGCSSEGDVVRVTTYDVSDAALADHGFTIWFEG